MGNVINKTRIKVVKKQNKEVFSCHIFKTKNFSLVSLVNISNKPKSWYTIVYDYLWDIPLYRMFNNFTKKIKKIASKTKKPITICDQLKSDAFN